MIKGISIAWMWISRVWAMLTALITLITGAIQGTPADIEGAHLVNETQYVLEEAYVMGQGLACDENYFYTSGAISALYMGGLGKIDRKTGELVQKKMFALSTEFTSKGYDHIGGIAYYDGKIYAPVEDKEEKYPLVLIYDAETLEYTGTYYDCTVEYLDDGIPWCAVDYDRGYLYTSTFHNAEEIVAYNLDDMTFSHIIPLSQPVDRIQSGAYLDGKLYLNLDPHNEDATKTVYSVDIETGGVSLVFTRNTSGIETETEGICVEKAKDGSVRFFIADYDKTVAMFLREYSIG
ncbi:MAG: hypothetical protein MJ177_02935 [Clostridia bacterium]|nr:hypothetical protein [Clostridia bacterium]